MQDSRQREIDRLEETDLDDVDLISEATKKKQIVKKPPHPLVPSLDFDKLRRIQEEERNKLRIIKNELDEDIPFEEHNNVKVDDNDEDYEERSIIHSDYKEHFIEGTPMNSQSEETLLITQELMMRKAEVITQLNEIYAKEGGDEEQLNESEDSALYYEEQ